MEHQSEPCAALPKTHLSIDLVRCQHHQAWTLAIQHYEEDGHDIRDVDPSIAWQFGPFDAFADVVAQVVAILTDAARYQGLRSL